jgi:hypothetical protein
MCHGVGIVDKRTAALLVASVALCVTGFALMQVVNASKTIATGSGLQFQRDCTGSDVGKDAAITVKVWDHEECYRKAIVNATFSVYVNGSLVSARYLQDTDYGTCGSDGTDSSASAERSVPVGRLGDGTLVEVTVSIVEGQGCEIRLVELNQGIDALAIMFGFCGAFGIAGTILVLAGASLNTIQVKNDAAWILWRKRTAHLLMRESIPDESGTEVR